jgi:hypothetical protein
VSLPPSVSDTSPAISRKFAIIFAPSGVSTLSGWNWTPKRFFSVCASPMITPSGVCAVIRSCAGTLPESTHSEW